MSDGMLRFPCPKCGRRLKAPLDKVGSKATCSCGEKMLVPNGSVGDSGEAACLAIPESPESNQPASGFRWDLAMVFSGCGLFLALGIALLVVVLNSGNEKKPDETTFSSSNFNPDNQPPNDGKDRIKNPVVEPKEKPKPADEPKEKPKPPDPEPKVKEKLPVKVPEPEPKPKPKEPDKAPDPPPKKPAEKMPEEIRQAIEGGVKHLQARVAAEEFSMPYRDPLGNAVGVKTGAAGLVGLTLLEAGVSWRDPGVQKLLKIVRRDGPDVTHIYSLGAILLFLNRLNEAEPLADADRRLLRTLSLRIVAGQLDNGLWTYRNPPLSFAQEKHLLEQLKAGTFKPTKKKSGTYGGSNSMTQFALLSLWGSRKHIPVRQPILHAAARFHSTQSSQGTWNYARPDMANFFQDSNTCAGLLALAMEKTLREDKEFRGVTSKSDPPVNSRATEQRDKAFAHLATIIGREAPPKSGTKPGVTGKLFGADALGDFYFLWCLERVSVIYSVDNIGGKDWYRWGSSVILKAQKEDGSWSEHHGDVPDTCFAILFLTKANLARDLTESLRLLDPIERPRR